MKAIRILSCICTMALGLTLHGSLAAAQPATISCGAAIDNYFTQTSRLNVVGTRVTARGAFGFSSFTMANGYEVATTPLHTPAAGAQSIFTAAKGSSYFTGPFHEVFPERGNGDVDLADFWVYRTGAFYLRATDWTTAWELLQGVTCYRGPQSQTVVTGYIHIAGWGTDFWTFVLKGEA